MFIVKILVLLFGGVIGCTAGLVLHLYPEWQHSWQLLKKGPASWLMWSIGSLSTVQDTIQFSCNTVVLLIVLCMKSMVQYNWLLHVLWNSTVYSRPVISALLQLAETVSKFSDIFRVTGPHINHSNHLLPLYPSRHWICMVASSTQLVTMLWRYTSSCQSYCICYWPLYSLPVVCVWSLIRKAEFRCSNLSSYITCL
jgi:hypothetical protein